ncbi:MAG: hypothetical protein V4538_01795 [Bacteroidota bacterium]
MKRVNNWQSKLASMLGMATAIANAWITIDWENFDIQKAWPKLLLSAIIALGGWKSQIKTKQQN